MLKVLTLETWNIMFTKNEFTPHFLWPNVECVLDEFKDRQMDPIVHKNGWYYDRHKNISWAEFDGYAVSIDSKYFKFYVNLMNVTEFGLYKMKELQAICNTKYATKEQKNILHTMKYIKDLRMMEIDRFKRYRNR